MKKGKFIVIEGGEGAGKGMVIEDLKNHFEYRKECNIYQNDVAYNTIFTREPGGTEVSEEIRKILMNYKMFPLTELFLFCGARVQHVKELILPALEAEKNVICDRFSYSTVAYQIYGRYFGGELVVYDQLNGIATAGLKPDAVIYLDVKPAVGLERKLKSQDGHCTEFDKEDLEFHERVRIGYLNQYEIGAKERSDPVWHLIETTVMSEQEVKDNAWNIVRKTLNL